MDILKRPAFSIVIAFVCSVVYGWIKPEKAQVMMEMWAFVGIVVLVLAIHELGHVIFGLLNGLKFKFMTAGPITVQKEGGKIRIRENKMWLYFGGVAMLLPPSIHTPNLSKKWAWMTLGGPITSLVCGLLSGYIYMVSYYQFLLYFSVLHFAIFLATAIPIKGIMLSDGKQFLILIKGDENAKQHLHSIQVSSELLSLKRPKDWDEKLVEISEEKIKGDEEVREILSDLMLTFYSRCDREGMETGIACLDQVLQIPVTKENKYFVSGFHSWYLLYKVLYDMDDVSLKDMKQHAKAITRLDPHGYYRTQAILKYLEKDAESFHTYMKKAESELKNAEKIGGGYLQLEREWFQLLQKKLAI
ncbi:M50 family metallopeptidase [Bacillus pseudomycoides]|uniref:M50 family metallopeptidase n=1 Tax=Bacillus bingmayongensis TaxID=1150157 RepID=A0ABU5JTK6_9BACI|nr:M50 family metallopeptidase [Bacillus pseudomycoides]